MSLLINFRAISLQCKPDGRTYTHMYLYLRLYQLTSHFMIPDFTIQIHATHLEVYY